LSDVEIAVAGAEETIAALRTLEDTVTKKLVPKGLRVGGKILLETAIAEAPQKSGLTRAKLKISSSTRKGVSRVGVGLAAKDFTGETFYSAFLIYGHKVGSRKLGDNRKAVPANNFLARAATRSGQQAVAAAVEVWRQGIDAACANKGNAT
jgi:hypothetical protein